MARQLSASSGRIAVAITATPIGGDLLVAITGGRAHIGATAVGIRTGGPATASVITTPAHREDRVAAPAAEKLAKRLDRTVVVVAGIHYDGITKEEIEATLKLCDGLVEALAAELCGEG